MGLRREFTLECVYEVVDGVHVQCESFLVLLVIVSIRGLLGQINGFLKGGGGGRRGGGEGGGRRGGGEGGGRGG